MWLDLDAVKAEVQQGFAGRRVLVVGDLMLDRYVWGEVRRISPEAPVPVLRVRRETAAPGGAGNVAANLAALGLATAAVGLIGSDRPADELLTLLGSAGVDANSVVRMAGRDTPTKVRIVGDRQQMLRLDTESLEMPGESDWAALLLAVEKELSKGIATVVLSDYAKGTLAGDFPQRIIQRAREARIPIVVDPKGSDYGRYRGATLISPNVAELVAATGAAPDETEELFEAAAALRERLEVKYFAVTRSERGITLVDDLGRRDFPAVARDVFDVAGAGDTVASVIAAGLATSLPLDDVIRLANVAAGIVVSKVGTAVVRPKELLAGLEVELALENLDKVCDLATARERVAGWRQREEQVVFTNGCFDILHAGHVTLLEQARREGHRLVVGLNSDRSVRALKGPERPIVRVEDRARVLAALTSVDLVIIFDEDTPLNLITAITPHVIAKGGDYTEDQVVGGREVRSWGGRVALIPLLDGRSTSELVRKMNSREDAVRLEAATECTS